MLAVFQGNWLFSVSGFSFSGPPQFIEKDGFPYTTTGASWVQSSQKCHLQPILAHTEDSRLPRWSHNSHHKPTPALAEVADGWLRGHSEPALSTGLSGDHLSRCLQAEDAVRWVDPRRVDAGGVRAVPFDSCVLAPISVWEWMRSTHQGPMGCGHGLSARRGVAQYYTATRRAWGECVLVLGAGEWRVQKFKSFLN